MMIHHGDKDYADAAKEASVEARAKFEALIERGRESARSVFDKIHTEVPADCYARMGAMRFGYAAEAALQPLAEQQGRELELLDAADPRAAGLDGADDAQRILDMVAEGPGSEPGIEAEPKSEPGVPQLLLDIADRSSMIVHRHALSQMATAAGIDTRYLKKLVHSANPDLRELALDILHTHFGKTELQKDYRLVRAVSGQVRGFMSDKYRRIDSRPLLETFAEACQAIGAVPIDGVCSDVRVQLKAFLPIIFEPIENEPMLVGLAWHNSDFGAGSHALAIVILRLMCTNKATTENCFRQTHSGARLNEDIRYREETVVLDTKANQARLQDEIYYLLGPSKVAATMDLIKRADAEACDWSDFSGRLKKYLSKGEIAAAELAFNGADVVNLPPGKTVWRMSNALSWIAGQTESPDRRLELERLAGAVYARDKKIGDLAA